MASSRRTPDRAAKTTPRHGRVTRSTAPIKDDGPDDTEDRHAAVIARMVGLVSQRVGSSSRQPRRVSARPSSQPGHIIRKRPTQKRQEPRDTTKPKLRVVPVIPAYSHPSTFVWTWDRIPWIILVRILEHAAGPYGSKNSAQWLFAMSRTCRAFYSPAMKVLYTHPPSLSAMSSTMSHKFVDLMYHIAVHAEEYRQNNDYRRDMVASISMAPENTPSLKRRVGTELTDFVRLLPNLTDIELFHEFDLPPYHKSDYGTRWVYPPSLLEFLQSEDSTTTALAKLQSWKWCRRFMSPDMHITRIKEIHRGKSFSSLRTLSLVGFQVVSLEHGHNLNDEIPDHDRDYIDSIAEAIAVLVSLETLLVESSSIVARQFMSSLPATLKNLSIINCWNLNAEDLSAYLHSSGRLLQNLTLHHNHALSLAFLTDLGKDCPVLEILSMDFTLYRHLSRHLGSEPLFDTLLTKEQRPSWPRTIRSIELQHLPKWDADIAGWFFANLIESAPDMPMLRRLIIKATLDNPVRDRSSFRQKWVARLNKVFQRKWSAPVAYRSLSQWPAIQRSYDADRQISDDSSNGPDTPDTTQGISRASTRLRSSRRSRMILDEDSDSEIDRDFAASTRRGSPEDRDTADNPLFVHGMCDVVDIRVDNQRAREVLYNMEDFLGESSGASDGEWSEAQKFDDEREEAYAW